MFSNFLFIIFCFVFDFFEKSRARARGFRIRIWARKHHFPPVPLYSFDLVVSPKQILVWELFLDKMFFSDFLFLQRFFSNQFLFVFLCFTIFVVSCLLFLVSCCCFLLFFPFFEKRRAHTHTRIPHPDLGPKTQFPTCTTILF